MGEKKCEENSREKNSAHEIRKRILIDPGGANFPLFKTRTIDI